MTDPDIMDIVTMLRGPDRLEPYLCAAAAEDIERLRKERDEARVSVCLTALPPEYKTWRPEQVDYAVKLIAKDMGWDCFGKENTHG